jgi:hypothetical protein
MISGWLVSILALRDRVAFLLAPAFNVYITNPSDQAVHFIRSPLIRFAAVAKRKEQNG